MLDEWLRRMVADAESHAPPVPSDAPYPGWQFCIEERTQPTPELSERLKIWSEFKARNIREPVRVRWYKGLALALTLGNDISRCVYVCGSFEPNEFHFLSGYLRPGMTFVDGGANEGLYSLFASRCVGASGRVVAIEPSERELLRLRRNVSTNEGCENILVAETALSHAAGKASLRIAEDEHAGHNTLGDFIHSAIRTTGFQTVALERLDDLVARLALQRVDIIKMDLEGHESLALEGSRATLEKHRPVLLLEAQGEQLPSLTASIRKLDYEIHSFSEETGLPIGWQAGMELSANIVAMPIGAARKRRPKPE
jgi:FkbM family methyltransferase